MLINEMFKDGYIFSVNILIDNNLNKDTKLTFNVVETRLLFKGLKTLSFSKIIMSKLKNYL